MARKYALTQILLKVNKEMIIQLNEKEITEIIVAHMAKIMPTINTSDALNINFTSTRKQGEGNSILVDIEFGSRSTVASPVMATPYGVNPVEEIQEQAKEVEELVASQPEAIVLDAEPAQEEVIEPLFNHTIPERDLMQEAIDEVPEDDEPINTTESLF